MTYANVVSTVCLFILLGGVGYAATKINGKSIKNGTISGAKLRANTLGGKQIDESRLGIVPRASTAGASADSIKLGGKPASAFALAGSAGLKGDKGDTGPPGPGSVRQFTDSCIANVFCYAYSPVVNGVRARLDCNTSGLGTSLRLQTFPNSSGTQIGWSGTVSVEGVVKGVTGQAGTPYGDIVAGDGGAAAINVDLVVRRLDYDVWTHFVLGSFSDKVAAHPCALWGVITSP